jgi:hypothetical protein
MWLTGVFGIATKYSEALLSVKYRITNERGQMSGGRRTVGRRVPVGTTTGLITLMGPPVAGLGALIPVLCCGINFVCDCVPPGCCLVAVNPRRRLVRLGW